jgi:hypothetical protein
MKIILYADEKGEFKLLLKNLIRDKLPGIQIEQTDSEQQLSEALCRPLHNVSVLIAFIDDSKDVAPLLSLKPLFENTKLIWICSKNGFDLKESALLLSPLYISYPENNFQDVISILQHIEQKQNRTINRFEVNQTTAW